MGESVVRVLIVDDSAVMRNLIRQFVEKAPQLEVVGTAINGRFAATKVPVLKPDVIVLDIEMPDMNGIEFLKVMKEKNWDIPVVILSAVARKGAKVTMEALALGASDFITKPTGGPGQELEQVGQQLVSLLKAYGGKGKLSGDISVPPSEGRKGATGKKVPSQVERGYQTEFEKITPLREPGKPEIVAIGISTGGPSALRAVLSDVDPQFPLPILVVQHMPAGFTKEFAISLGKVCPLEVKEAGDGDLIKPGRILIAPGHAHIEVEQKALANIIRVKEGELVNGHMPSAGVLFESVAPLYKEKTLAIIMTGMGRDGSLEMGSVYREGGMTIAQDQDSSIVYGMPRVATEAGYIRKVVSLQGMAKAINSFGR